MLIHVIYTGNGLQMDYNIWNGDTVCGIDALWKFLVCVEAKESRRQYPHRVDKLFKLVRRKVSKLLRDNGTANQTISKICWQINNTELPGKYEKIIRVLGNINRGHKNPISRNYKNSW